MRLSSHVLARAVRIAFLLASIAAVACHPKHGQNSSPLIPESDGPSFWPPQARPTPTPAERMSVTRMFSWVPATVGTRIAALYHDGCATGAFYLEAEDFDGLWTSRTSLLGFSGRGFIVADIDGTQGGAIMSKRITVSDAGLHRVWARGYQGGQVSRRWQIKVDNTFLDVTHAGTVGERFEWQIAGDVWLSAGNHDVRILGTSDPDAVADAVLLTSNPDCNPQKIDERWLVLDPDLSPHLVFDEIMDRTRLYESNIQSPTSLEDWQTKAPALRERVLRAAGLSPLPDPTPLHARLVGTTPLRGYRIEKVVFESQPGMLVTANLYVPDGSGPFPAVLNPIGHDPEGKAVASAVARGQALARFGFVAMTYDPFGYGEREIDGNEHEQHFPLILTGHANTSIAIWDSVRALDYLTSRDDVDPARIAITGESGGGLNSLYASVLDSRISASSPVVYMTSWPELLGTRNSHDACTHVPGLASFTDLGEIGGLIAPLPQLFMNADEDANFTVAGAKRAEELARPIYDLFGAGDSLEAKIFSTDHEYSQEMREAFYAFADRYLYSGSGADAIPEPEGLLQFAEQSPVLQCFESGSIPQPSTTARDLAEGWATSAVLQLQDLPADREGLRRALEEVLHPPRASDPPAVEVVGQVRWSERTQVQKLQIRSEDKVLIPSLFLAPKKSGAPIAVIVDAAGNGKQVWMGLLHRAGLGALYVSPRGHGETAMNEYLAVTDNILLGDSLLGQRAFDIAQARRALGHMPGWEQSKVGLIALGPTAGLEALVAQALWGDFDAVAAGPMMGTYLEAFDPGIPLTAYVARMLLVADIPQIALLAGERPLKMMLLDDVLMKRQPAWYGRLNDARLIDDNTELDKTIAWLAQRLIN